MIIGNRDWKLLAKEELERRRLNQALTESLPVEGEERNKRQSTPKKSPPIYAASEVGINDISKHLIREFITRKDKTQGIVEWSKNYAKEAWKYGTKLTKGHAEELTVISYTINYNSWYHLFQRHESKSPGEVEVILLVGVTNTIPENWT